MYNIKVINTIYKLRYGDTALSAIKIARNVKEKFSLNDSLEEIRNFITKYYPKRGGPKKYSDFERAFLIRGWTTFYDKDKLIAYFNKKFNRTLTPTSLRCLMSDLKVKAHRKYPERQVSKEQINAIINDYKKGVTVTELAKKFGYKGHKSICDILQDNHISRRTQKEIGESNIEYSDLDFEKLDTKLKGYFLGLMLTDGYVVNQMAGIQLTDKDCIQFIHDNWNLPMVEIPYKEPWRKTMYRVILHGEKRLHDLASWGVVPRKSLSVDGPDITKIDKDILYYVIRGIIDGDGWIRKDGREFFICSASKKFIDWCENTLSYLGFSNMNKKFIPNGYNGIYHLRSARRENIALLKKFIYDKPFGMNRKYNKLH